MVVRVVRGTLLLSSFNQFKQFITHCRCVASLMNNYVRNIWNIFYSMKYCTLQAFRTFHRELLRS